MEGSERDLIQKMLKSNAMLKRLYTEHIELESKLSSYEHRPFLTSQEELEQKQLKLRKLKGKEKMMQILADYEQAA